MLIGAFLAGTSVLYVAYKLIDHGSGDWIYLVSAQDNEHSLKKHIHRK